MKGMIMNMKVWENNIRRVKPYVPGEQPKDKTIIKLNTNENPYPPAPGVANALSNMDIDSLKLYPDPTMGILVDEIADCYNVGSNQVFVGVGSDDVLSMAFMTFFNSDKPILYPDITYSFYPVWCDLYRVPYENPALDEDFRIVKEDYYKENGGVLIANPNAPTSLFEEINVIEDIVRHNPDSVVIIDEAYIDFAGESAISLIPKYENLLVIQTFSKSRSMAGMRIGYAIGSPKLIKALNDVKYSFNSYTLNQVAILAGYEAIKDNEYLEECVRKIVATRKRAEESFTKLGFKYLESGTNFLFVTHKDINAKKLYETLRESGIYTRYFDMPRIKNHLRVTIGTDDQMDIFFEFLKNYMKDIVQD